MRLKKIILKDFFSYKYLEYEFKNRAYQIKGVNKTDPSQVFNGSGKSNFISGIEYGIVGATSRKVKKTEIVRHGQDKAEVELFSECDVRKQSLHVHHTINLKGADKIIVKTRLYGDDKWVKASYSSVADGKKWVNDWYKIDKSDLFSFFIINSDNFKSFFSSPNSVKIELINRFSDASVIKGLDKIEKIEIERLIKALELELSSTQGIKRHIQGVLDEEKGRNLNEELGEEKQALFEEIEAVKKEIEDIGSLMREDRGTVGELKTSIAAIEAEKVRVKGDIKNLEIERQQKLSDMKLIESDLSRAIEEFEGFKSTDFDKKRQKHTSLIKSNYILSEEAKKIKEKHEKKINSLEQKISNITVKLEGAIKCPNCDHSFIPYDNKEELESSRDKLIETIPTVSEKLSKVKEVIEDICKTLATEELKVQEINGLELKEGSKKNAIKANINKIESSLNAIQKGIDKSVSRERGFEQKITSLDNEIENIYRKIEYLNKDKRAGYIVAIKNKESEIESIKNEIKNLVIEDNGGKIKEYEDSFNQISEKEKIIKNKLHDVSEQLTKAKKWEVIFKQFRSYVANQSLSVMQYHINRFLKEQGTDMFVKLEGFKTLKKGEIREEITTHIIRGFERTFESFSGGERGRLLLASILTNRYLINNAHPYGGLDFIAADEVFDKVDPVGIRMIVESAKLLKVPVFIVTQNLDEEQDADTIIAIKEDNITTLKY